MIIIGTGIMGISLQNFYDPIGLVTGGFTGLCDCNKDCDSGYYTWRDPFMVHKPCDKYSGIYIGIYNNGKEVCRTFAFGTVMLSVWLYIIPPLDLSQKDYLLVAIFGAVFSGLGMGIVLRGHGTTGGTEMVAKTHPEKR